MVRHLIILILWLIGFLLAGGRVLAQTDEPATPPNILLIVSDDQRYDTMAYMPQTSALIFEAGVTFERAYVTTSRCCPSRASILTGLYAHNHNVRLNQDRLLLPTLPNDLQEHGYYTGIVGKYLNSYPVNKEEPPRPEYDRWVVMKSGPETALYNNPNINVDGEWWVHEGYQTHILRDYAIDFLKEAATLDQPFYLMFSPYAPHLPAKPAPGDEMLFLEEPSHRPPNFNPEDMTGKPNWMQGLSFINDRGIAEIDRRRLRQIQSLVGLDAAVAALYSELEDLELLDNTIIIYISDNGYYWGEHRLSAGKTFVYEEGTHVPLGIRHPDFLGQAHEEQRLAANIDIAPTLYEVAGLPLPTGVDGRSLMPLIRNESNLEWRPHLLIEGWPLGAPPVNYAPPFQGIHDGRFVYIETMTDSDELYDIETDPFQLRNLAGDPVYGDIESRLRQSLEQERLNIPPPSPESGASDLAVNFAIIYGKVRRILKHQLLDALPVWVILTFIYLIISGHRVFQWRQRRSATDR